MSSEFPRSPQLIKGALVKLSSSLVVPIPEVIMFQYNPEKLSRSITIHSPSGGGNTRGGQSSQQPATVQPQPPGESITLTLELDAADGLEKPESHPVTILAGVADRLAALELLLYPDPSASGLLQDVASALGGSLPGLPSTERATVPPCFFIWGPGRILPVRINTFSVEEQEFLPSLYPSRATVNLTLVVLRAGDSPGGFTHSASTSMANFAWTYHRVQQQALAIANTLNNVESVIGMLPF